jgi:hypothetical protein
MLEARGSLHQAIMTCDGICNCSYRSKAADQHIKTLNRIFPLQGVSTFQGPVFWICIACRGVVLNLFVRGVACGILHDLVVRAWGCLIVVGCLFDPGCQRAVQVLCWHVRQMQVAQSILAQLKRSLPVTAYGSPHSILASEQCVCRHPRTRDSMTRMPTSNKSSSHPSAQRSRAS